MKLALTILIIAVITILSLLFIHHILKILNEVRYLISARKKFTVTESERENIQLSQDYLALILEIAHVEVNRLMGSLLAVNGKYDILNLDKDVETISEKVFNSIDKDFFLRNKSILTKEYINDYIINNVKFILIAEMKSLNDRLRDINQ